MRQRLRTWWLKRLADSWVEGPSGFARWFRETTRYTNVRRIPMMWMNEEPPTECAGMSILYGYWKGDERRVENSYIQKRIRGGWFPEAPFETKYYDYDDMEDENARKAQRKRAERAGFLCKGPRSGAKPGHVLKGQDHSRSIP